MKKKNQTIKTDSKEKKMLKVLIERHNALARYVGVPYCIDPDVVASSPASFDKHPNFLKVTANRLYVPPYSALVHTKWSPASQMLNTE